jgi:hypothetical protein
LGNKEQGEAQLHCFHRFFQGPRLGFLSAPCALGSIGETDLAALYVIEMMQIIISSCLLFNRVRRALLFFSVDALKFFNLTFAFVQK